MTQDQIISPAKRKRLLKTYGSRPAGYTSEDIERFLDLLYGMYNHIYTSAQLQQVVVCDPFDRSATPRQLKITDLTDWLETLLL